MINKNKLKFQDIPEFVNAFAKLRETIQKGYVNEDYLMANGDNEVRAISTGEAAMCFIQSGIITLIDQSYPDKVKDIGAFVLPGDNPDISGTMVWPAITVFIPQKGKNIEIAKKWVAFLASKEGQEAYYKSHKIDGPQSYKNLIEISNVPDSINELIRYVDSGKIVSSFENQLDVEIPGLKKICVDTAGGLLSPQQAAEEVDKALAKGARAKGLIGW